MDLAPISTYYGTCRIDGNMYAAYLLTAYNKKMNLSYAVC